MKFTLSWLSDHLDTSAHLDDLTRTLTAIGLEVENTQDSAALFDGFIVGHIQDAKPHPNADRLRLCLVDIGEDAPVQVVCGAPNARTGIKVCYAPENRVIPATGTVLKAAKIRGFESKGMLCSSRELTLGDDHDGILEIPEDIRTGSPFSETLSLDPVIEIAVTPNRADCLGVRGIARDLAAAGLGSLKPDPWGDSIRGPIAASRDIPISVEIDPECGCAHFVGRSLFGVKNGPSPEWLQNRLIAVGLRPINALVDITNYVAIDRARPLHAFDIDKIKGGLVIRHGQKDEILHPVVGDTPVVMMGGECVIYDQSGPVSLAGVMGGASTGSSTETQNVFFEAAWFDPVKIATTGRKHGIQSDARYRFERGVDPESAVNGVNMATRMTLDICGGTITELVEAGAPPLWQHTVPLHPQRCASLGGLHVTPEMQKSILTSLGFTAEDTPGFIPMFSVPSWRQDIKGEADLVEEILRIQSLDAIPEVPLPRLHTVTRPGLSPKQQRTRRIKRLLASQGLHEAITFSFMKEEMARLFGWTDERLRLINPISSELSVMRPSILPNLLQASIHNINYGLSDIALFEVGPVYPSADGDSQQTHASGLMVGHTDPIHWSYAQRTADVFDAKAHVMAVLTHVKVPTENLTTSMDAPEWYHPGRSGVLRLGATPLAIFGELHPAIIKHISLSSPAIGFEIFLSSLPLPRRTRRNKGRQDHRPFPYVDRDFAFIIKDNIWAKDVLQAVRSADKDLITHVNIFDIYTGKGIEAGYKSLALRVRLHPKKTTLTDTEIEAVCQSIETRVHKKTGGVLRT